LKPPDRMMKATEVAEYLGVPLTTLTVWRCRRQGPRYYKFGRHVRYDFNDIRKWVASNARGTA
jgi:excisionase family DNA binding protein